MADLAWNGSVATASGSGSSVDINVGRTLFGTALLVWVNYWPRYLSTTTLRSGINYYDSIGMSITNAVNATFDWQPTGTGLSFGEFRSISGTSGHRAITIFGSGTTDANFVSSGNMNARDLPGGSRTFVQSLANASAFSTVRVKFFSQDVNGSSSSPYTVTYDIRIFSISHWWPHTISGQPLSFSAAEPMSINGTPVGNSFPADPRFSFAGSQSSHLQAGKVSSTTDGGDSDDLTPSPVNVPQQTLEYGITGYWGQLTTSGFTWTNWTGATRADTISPSSDTYADNYYELWYKIINPEATKSIGATGTFGSSTDTQTLPPGVGGDERYYYRADFSQPFYSLGSFSGRSMRGSSIQTLRNDVQPVVGAIFDHAAYHRTGE